MVGFREDFEVSEDESRDDAHQNYEQNSKGLEEGNQCFLSQILHKELLAFLAKSHIVHIELTFLLVLENIENFIHLFDLIFLFIGKFYQRVVRDVEQVRYTVVTAELLTTPSKSAMLKVTNTKSLARSELCLHLGVSTKVAVVTTNSIENNLIELIFILVKLGEGLAPIESLLDVSFLFPPFLLSAFFCH